MMRRRSSSRSRRRITLIIMIVSVLLSLSDCVLSWCGVMVWRRSVGFYSRRVAYHILLHLVMVVLATQTRYKCHVDHSPSSTSLLFASWLLSTIVPHPYDQPSTTATDPTTLTRILPCIAILLLLLQIDDRLTLRHSVAWIRPAKAFLPLLPLVLIPSLCVVLGGAFLSLVGSMSHWQYWSDGVVVDTLVRFQSCAGRLVRMPLTSMPEDVQCHCFRLVIDTKTDMTGFDWGGVLLILVR